ncbi:hypothetical protein B0H13DRAFT_1871845 [Mycena leptocephala]|nr:hypothetical protein B0H13DRAFT_1871845 [Mycena leptocephala]
MCASAHVDRALKKDWIKELQSLLQISDNFRLLWLAPESTLAAPYTEFPQDPDEQSNQIVFFFPSSYLRFVDRFGCIQSDLICWRGQLFFNTNQGHSYETIRGVQKMWTELWATIHRVTGAEVKLKFIHGEGLRTALFDGNNPQANSPGADLVARNKLELSGISVYSRPSQLSRTGRIPQYHPYSTPSTAVAGPCPSVPGQS